MLVQAIKLWKDVSEHIIAREALLVEIEMFERTASDPEYVIPLLPLTLQLY